MTDSRLPSYGQQSIEREIWLRHYYVAAQNLPFSERDKGAEHEVAFSFGLVSHPKSSPSVDRIPSDSIRTVASPLADVVAKFDVRALSAELAGAIKFWVEKLKEVSFFCVECSSRVRSTVYVHRSGDTDFGFEPNDDPAHAHRYFSEHQHPGGRGRLVVQRHE